VANNKNVSSFVELPIENEQNDLSPLKRAILKALEKHADLWKRLPDDKAILVDRHGQPVVVMLTYQHFESILEELEDLRDAKRAREVLDAIRKGEEKTISLAEVEAELRAEGILNG
jgi:PHD/YefM family antitoxin component YafN of YafNO toxin-antitoxin module